MGGGQSLNFGLAHLDTFAWVGGFSSAPNTKPPEQLVPDPAAATRQAEAVVAVLRQQGWLDPHQPGRACLSQGKAGAARLARGRQRPRRDALEKQLVAVLAAHFQIDQERIGQIRRVISPRSCTSTIGMAGMTSPVAAQYSVYDELSHHRIRIFHPDPLGHWRCSSRRQRRPLRRPPRRLK